MIQPLLFFAVQYYPQLFCLVLYCDFSPFKLKYQQSTVFAAELAGSASSLLPFLSRGKLVADQHLNEHHIVILEFTIIILSSFFVLSFSSLYVFTNIAIFQP